MSACKIFRHEAYELHCSAVAVGSARFAPAVVVYKQVWPTRPRNIAMSRSDCSTEEIAIEAARTQGIEWIRNYG